MTINEYLAYIDYFNSRQYDRYYTEDVVVQLPTQQLQGKQAVKDFYAGVNRYVHETIRVKQVWTGADTLVANIWSDFYCLNDWPEFSVCPVTRGQLVRVELVVMYNLSGEVFSRIRAGRVGAVMKSLTQ